MHAGAVCVCVHQRLKAWTVTKSYFPLTPQIQCSLPIACGSSFLWRALRGPDSTCEVARTRGHVIEARWWREQRLSRRRAVTVLQCLSHRAVNTLPTRSWKRCVYCAGRHPKVCVRVCVCVMSSCWVLRVQFWLTECLLDWLCEANKWQKIHHC